MADYEVGVKISFHPWGWGTHCMLGAPHALDIWWAFLCRERYLLYPDDVKISFYMTVWAELHRLSFFFLFFFEVSRQLLSKTLAPTSGLASNLRSYSSIGWGECKEGGRWQSWRICNLPEVANYSDSNEGSFGWRMYSIQYYVFWKYVYQRLKK